MSIAPASSAFSAVACVLLIPITKLSVYFFYSLAKAAAYNTKTDNGNVHFSVPPNKYIKLFAVDFVN